MSMTWTNSRAEDTAKCSRSAKYNWSNYTTLFSFLKNERNAKADNTTATCGYYITTPQKMTHCQVQLTYSLQTLLLSNSFME